MELGIGSGLKGKTFLDIGSNQGYTSLEASMRGGLVTAIEPYAPNRVKTELVLERNGYLGRSAEVLDLLMENLGQLKRRFDGIFFLGTLYHAEKPWDIIETVSQLTDVCVFETQVCRPSEANDQFEDMEFRAFMEGPGTDLDDPKKNYLRQVLSTKVRVPTLDSVSKLFNRSGFGLVLISESFVNQSGQLSDLYKARRGVIGLALKDLGSATRFNF